MLPENISQSTPLSEKTPSFATMSDSELKTYIENTKETIAEIEAQRFDIAREMLKTANQETADELREMFPNLDIKPEKLSEEAITKNQHALDKVTPENAKQELAEVSQIEYDPKLQAVGGSLATLYERGSQVLSEAEQKIAKTVRNNFWGLAIKGGVALSLLGFMKGDDNTTTTYDYGASLYKTEQQAEDFTQQFENRANTVDIRDYLHDRQDRTDFPIAPNAKQEQMDVVLEPTTSFFGNISTGIRNSLYDILPSSAATVTADLFLKNALGLPVDEKPITEKQLTIEEKQVLRTLAKKALSEGRMSTSYNDYPKNINNKTALETTTFNNRELYSPDKEGLRKLVSDILSDPVTNMIYTFGRVSLWQNSEGDLIITDQYDFRSVDMVGEQGMYGKIRKTLQPYITPEIQKGELINTVKPLRFLINLGAASDIVDSPNQLKNLPLYQNKHIL